MDSKQASALLHYHAGLPREESPPLDQDASLSTELWRVQRRTPASGLSAAFHEVLECIQALNVDAIAETTNAHPRLVSREVAYSIAVIIDKAFGTSTWLQASNQDSQRLRHLTGAVVHAWQQALAGDIDDVMADLENYGLSIDG